MNHSKNPFIYPEAIDDGRETDELANVLQENRKRGIVAAGANTLKAVVNATEDINIDELQGIVLEPATREHFIENILQTEALFDRTGLEMPSVSEMIASEIDFGRLASEWEAMEQSNMQPQLIIAPHGTPLTNWVELYSDLTADKSIPNNPLKNHVVTFTGTSWSGLSVGEKVREHWDSVNVMPLYDANDQKTPVCGNRTSVSQHWSARVIAGKPVPSSLKQMYRAGSIDYVTVPEYLTLQALTVQRGDGEHMLDVRYRTWLHGPFTLIVSKSVPNGWFTPEIGIVTISNCVIETSMDNLGHRPVKG